jgi:uncharacterized cupredoxin-like copper-binding protein
VKNRTSALIAILATLGLLTACGDDNASDGGSDASVEAPAAGARTIDVVMDDIDFSPDTISVTAGAITHDAFLGDAAEQAEHEADMAAAAATTTMAGMDGMDGMHDTHGTDSHAEHLSNAVTVQPGDTQTFTHTFAAGEILEIGCHQPGHYAAGMKITLQVG